MLWLTREKGWNTTLGPKHIKKVLPVLSYMLSRYRKEGVTPRDGRK